MDQRLTPRDALKGLLQGIVPARPLFLPIVFALGAKIENTPLPAYLTNPTKITNAQRQIHTRLRSDGVSCYFDPNLEAEALGAIISRSANDDPPTSHWRSNLRTPEEAANHPRVKVATEVIQRLKSLLRDEPLLQAGVNGPFTVAAQLAQQTGRESINREDLPEAAIELAAATITQIATKLAEAGAQVIFIREEILPTLTTQTAEAWSATLAPAINIIRFYQALPVLQITSPQAFAENQPRNPSTKLGLRPLRNSRRCTKRNVPGGHNRNRAPSRHSHPHNRLPIRRIHDTKLPPIASYYN